MTYEKEHDNVNENKKGNEKDDKIVEFSIVVPVRKLQHEKL